MDRGEDLECFMSSTETFKYLWFRIDIPKENICLEEEEGKEGEEGGEEEGGGEGRWRRRRKVKYKGYLLSDREYYG